MLDYLKMLKSDRFFYKTKKFFVAIPVGIANKFKKIGLAIGTGIVKVFKELKDILVTFIDGDWKTRMSYLVMGFGCLARGQILRGILFLLFEIVFIAYMVLTGSYWLSMLPSLGKVGPGIKL